MEKPGTLSLPQNAYLYDEKAAAAVRQGAGILTFPMRSVEKAEVTKLTTRFMVSGRRVVCRYLFDETGGDGD